MRIFDFLTQEPREWGDPIRHYHGLKLMQYRGQHWNFQCMYSVHDRVPIVFLNQIILLPRNPLFGMDLM